MFGYCEGTDRARAIEALLEAEGIPSADRLSTLAIELRATLFPSTASAV